MSLQTDDGLRKKFYEIESKEMECISGKCYNYCRVVVEGYSMEAGTGFVLVKEC